MSDIYDSYETGIDGPAIGHEAVTPSDSVDLVQISRTLYIGSTGDVTVVAKNGVTATYSSVPAGTFIPLRAVRVNATGTTASNIVSMF